MVLFFNANLSYNMIVLTYLKLLIRKIIKEPMLNENNDEMIVRQVK